MKHVAGFLLSAFFKAFVGQLLKSSETALWTVRNCMRNSQVYWSSASSFLRISWRRWRFPTFGAASAFLVAFTFPDCLHCMCSYWLVALPAYAAILTLFTIVAYTAITLIRSPPFSSRAMFEGKLLLRVGVLSPRHYGTCYRFQIRTLRRG